MAVSLKLIDLRLHLDAPSVLNLLTEAFGSQEAALRAAARFRARDWTGLAFQEGGLIVGFIGVEVLSPSAARIRGVAVEAGHRGEGIGRQLVQAVKSRSPSVTLHAETDACGVAFYTRCGFQASTLGERYPGIERFECVLRG